MKKIIAVVLSVLITISLFAKPVFAVDASEPEVSISNKAGYALR